jgi:hypothetical protein
MLFLSAKPLQGQTEPRVGHQCAVAPYNAGVRCHGSCLMRKAADLPTMEIPAAASFQGVLCESRRSTQGQEAQS